ncbi:MAG: PD40 domain-containing protein [Verrucomicrobia bacterium]|nr:PD40 domain-containing protein [Verrucomicrobiota bacterium]
MRIPILLGVLLASAGLSVGAADEAALFEEFVQTREPGKAVALAQRGEAAVPFLTQGLEKGGRMAALCAWALWQHPQPDVAPALRERLLKVDQVAGYYAARALGKVPSTENVAALSALLAKETNAYWELSSGGVGRLRDAWNESGQRYNQPAPTNMANLRVAYAAMEALGELGGEEAVTTLLRALDSDQYLIRYGAARGLARALGVRREAALSIGSAVSEKKSGTAPTSPRPPKRDFVPHSKTLLANEAVTKLKALADKDPVLIVRLAARQALAVAHGEVPASFDILRTSPVWFPLTPALSSGEREKRSQSPDGSKRAGSPRPDELAQSRRTSLPLPEGERRGEGDQSAQFAGVARSPPSAAAEGRLEARPTMPPSLAFIKTKHRSDATFGFRDSYFFPKTPKYHSGENLYTLTPPRPDGVLKNLTQLENGEVQGPEVSFDGTKILFAMRRDKTRDGFHIFELDLNLAGQNEGEPAPGAATVTSTPHSALRTPHLKGLRQLTDGNSNDVDPTYLPDGRIAFCSDRCGWQEYYHQERSRVLYVMNADGSGVQQITCNPNQDYEPFVLSDGRISYSSYRFYAQDGSEGPLPGEWMGLARIETVLRACNPDGSADQLFYGAMRGPFYVPMRPMPFSDQFAGWHGRGYHVGVSVSQQKEMPDGRIICTTPAGLTLVDPARAPLDCEIPIFPEVVNLAGGEEVYIHNYDEMNPVGRFTSPYPAGGDWVWVSHAPWHDLRVNGYGLYLLNVATRELELVYDDLQMSDVDPVPLAPQPRPLARSSTLKAPSLPLTRPSGTLSPSEGERDGVRGTAATGLILCNSVFNTDQPLDKKSVRYVRVLEGVQMGQSIAANAAFRTRILGQAPIHPDGSFYVEVPADVPIHFELLDADGRMLIHETEFNSVRPGETKGCTGCHEIRKETSPNARPLALADPPFQALRQHGDLIYMGQHARPYNRVYRE